MIRSDLHKIINLTECSILFSLLCSQTYADNYWNFSAPAKKRKPVELLVSKDLKRYLDAVEDNRELADVSATNPYLFGLVHPLEPQTKFLDAYQVMRNFAKNCNPPGKERWKIMKATELRKQVATYVGIKQLNSHEISQIARFLGHSEAIHHGIYRQDQLLQLCVWMTKFLESAKGQDDQTQQKKTQKKPWEAPGRSSDKNEDMEIGEFNIFLLYSLCYIIFY